MLYKPYLAIGRLKEKDEGGRMKDEREKVKVEGGKMKDENRVTSSPKQDIVLFRIPHPSSFLFCLYAYFRLIRPINGLIAFMAVILGAFLAGSNSDSLGKVIITAIAALLLLSAGNALNDFYDIETDKINRPLRPIPSGHIKRRSALIFAIALFILGASLGLFVSRAALIVAIIVSILLVFYTTKLREFILIGNIVIGLLTGLTFVSGGIASESIGRSFIPATFAFLFITGREIVKDIQDIKGDRAAGMLSLPLKWGQRKSVYISLIFLAMVIIISPIPYVLNIYSFYYLICVIFGVDLVMVYCIWILLKAPLEKSAAKVANLMKFDIFIGLGAIYIGNIGLV